MLFYCLSLCVYLYVWRAGHRLRLLARTYEHIVVSCDLIVLLLFYRLYHILLYHILYHIIIILYGSINLFIYDAFEGTSLVRVQYLYCTLPCSVFPSNNTWFSSLAVHFIV